MMMRRAMPCRTAYPSACCGIEAHIAVQVDPAPAHQPAGGYGYHGYGGHQGYNYGGYGGGLVCVCIISKDECSCRGILKISSSAIACANAALCLCSMC
jgi:hypothetical protein